jgi:hypothetical protein
MRSHRRRRAWLFCEPLEERAVPAFDLAIDGDAAATFNVTRTTAPSGYTTFTASGPGATLKVSDIAGALATGPVSVSTGFTGSEDGNVTWTHTSANDDLDMSGSNGGLSLFAERGSLVGTVTLDGVRIDAAGHGVGFYSSNPDNRGLVQLINGTQINDAGGLGLAAGAGEVVLQLGSTRPAVDGGIIVQAATVENKTDGFVLQSRHGNVEVQGALLLTGGMTLRADEGFVIVLGATNSPTGRDLHVYGGTTWDSTARSGRRARWATCSSTAAPPSRPASWRQTSSSATATPRARGLP